MPEHGSVNSLRQVHFKMGSRELLTIKYLTVVNIII